MLLLENTENTQFLSNYNETQSENGTHENLILTEFCNDWIKIMDF